MASLHYALEVFQEFSTCSNTPQMKLENGYEAGSGFLPKCSMKSFSMSKAQSEMRIVQRLEQTRQSDGHSRSCIPDALAVASGVLQILPHQGKNHTRFAIHTGTANIKAHTHDLLGRAS